MLLLFCKGIISIYFSTGPALLTTKDAGDAITLLQSLAGSTFDSSQLVLTACMGFQNVSEPRLQELRNKYRPDVIDALAERSKGLRAWRDSQVLASKLYGFNHDSKSVVMGTNKTEQSVDSSNGDLSREGSGSLNSEVVMSLTGDLEAGSAPDLQEQVVMPSCLLCFFIGFEIRCTEK